MAPQTTTFAFIIITFLALVSCYASLHDEASDNYQDNESGYDFHAYPSYFSTGEASKFDNSARLRTESYGLSNFVRYDAASIKTINVVNFGAKGDGSDDTEAFQDAWKEACSSSTQVNFVVPKKMNFLIKPIRFSGPCKSDITVQVYGTIEATTDQSAYKKDSSHWLRFDNVQNLLVEGGGTIDGNGKIWWQNSCKIDKTLPCKHAPTALTFYSCKNLVVNNIKIQNAQQMHVSFEKCVNVEASNLMVTSPEESPNTDGIHVTNTQNIQISSSTIGTGDDCISIESGSKKVQATDITCGPGHGISIGSLGDDNSEAHVSDIVVNGATLSGTTNGVRIKTWQGGSGSASNIKFQNINMRNVKNPIIIDQNYCDQDKPCKKQSSTVQVKNVMYQNIKGTSATNVAIDFNCSKSFPCQGIVLQNVDLEGEGDEASKAVCNNVELNYVGGVSPHCP